MLKYVSKAISLYNKVSNMGRLELFKDIGILTNIRRIKDYNIYKRPHNKKSKIGIRFIFKSYIDPYECRSKKSTCCFLIFNFTKQVNIADPPYEMKDLHINKSSINLLFNIVLNENIIQDAINKLKAFK